MKLITIKATFSLYFQTVGNALQFITKRSLESNKPLYPVNLLLNLILLILFKNILS